MTYQEAVIWVRRIVRWDMPHEEAYACWLTYRQYRDEGQSHEVSKQYAGLA